LRCICTVLVIAAMIAVPLQVLSAPIVRSPPLPRPRPAEAPARPAPNKPAPEPVLDQACLNRLGAAGMEFVVVTARPGTNPDSVIETPVGLKIVKLAPGWRTSIRLPDEPTLSCLFAERFGHWFHDLVAPLIAGELAVELNSVRTGPGYECRNRNGAKVGKI